MIRLETLLKGIIYDFIFIKEIYGELYTNTGPYRTDKQHPDFQIAIVILQWNQDEANSPEIQ